MNVFGVVSIAVSLDFRWSRAKVAGASTAMSLSNAAMLPIDGRLADHFGVVSDRTTVLRIRVSRLLPRE